MRSIVYQVGINKGIILRCTAYQISRLYCRVKFLEWQFARKPNVEVIATLLSDFDSQPGTAKWRNFAFVVLQHVNDDIVSTFK